MTAGVDLDVEALLQLRLLASSIQGTRKPPRSPLPGVALHRQRGRGLEVYDIRAWSEGDDLRHLDRNVTARTGTPHVRTFRDERERNITLIADFRESMLFGTRRALRSVAAAEVLSGLAWRVIEDAGSVALLAATGEGLQQIGRARNAPEMTGLLHELADVHAKALAYPASGEPPLSDILSEAASLAGKGEITLASALDTPGAQFDSVAEHLARRRGLSIVLIADSFEIKPGPGDYPFQTQDGNAGRLHITRGDIARAIPADDRLARLRRLGVDFLKLESTLDAEAMMAALERFNG